MSARIRKTPEGLSQILPDRRARLRDAVAARALWSQGARPGAVEDIRQAFWHHFAQIQLDFPEGTEVLDSTLAAAQAFCEEAMPGRLGLGGVRDGNLVDVCFLVADMSDQSAGELRDVAHGLLNMFPNARVGRMMLRGFEGAAGDFRDVEDF